jgi:hypothetical protein
MKIDRLHIHSPINNNYLQSLSRLTDLTEDHGVVSNNLSSPLGVVAYLLLLDSPRKSAGKRRRVVLVEATVVVALERVAPRVGGGLVEEDSP